MVSIVGLVFMKTLSPDVDLEHHDIMQKAFRSYSQHCRDERFHNNNGSSNANAKSNTAASQTLSSRFDESFTKLNGHYHHYHHDYQHHPDMTNPRQSIQDSDTFSSGAPESIKSMPADESRQFKLAQCRLHFHDDEDDADNDDYHHRSTRKTKRVQSSILSPRTSSSTALYPLVEGDGVLVDSVGHVYKSKHPRPWSAAAVPGRHSGLVSTNKQGLFQFGNRFNDTTSPSSSSTATVNGNTHRHHSSPQRRTRPSSGSSAAFGDPYLRTVTLKFGDKMSQPIPRSVAYQRRNQTTHMWTDSSQLMSTSLPTADFLHRNFGSSSSSPRSSRDATSERTSPAGKPTLGRPNSSYSYDGGFFVGAHSGQADYFVIHPDWVSEAMSIKKLNISKKNNGPPLTRSMSLRLRPGQGRRCLSAPPKNRNPITWDQSDPVNIPSK